MTNTQFDWAKTRQLNWVQLVAAFGIPSAIAFTGFHAVLPLLHANGMPAIVAWPIVASVMLLGFTLAPLWLMNKEARELGINLRSRMCLKPLDRRQWLFASGILVVGLVVAGGTGGLNTVWSEFSGLSAPDHFPFFLDPTIDPISVLPSDLTPGFRLKGAYWLIGLMVVTLLLNILVEELYFRAWLLPKMFGLGAAAWVVNGVAFALYHTFQLWLLPQLIPLSLFMAFVVYKTRSIWPAFVFHFLVNSLNVIAIAYLVIS
ncbi:lysostaphin resistance A-like protein [Maritalea sp.]|uniref:CPBP family intramembrane glutamic endopeptidase n=1 Tax=Maritalea sp. TaxID=2003361 RepID=UPI003EF95A20